MSISKVGTYAFYNHPNLERATVSASVIEANAFQNATKLETVDLTSTAADTINANAFSGCSNLTHLVVRSTARSSLSATSALAGTKIKFGDGGVYVPANLLDSYKGATNWSAIAASIYPIGEYPKTNFDTISDSWSTILTNSDYATAYAVKDTKTIELTDGTKIKMDLAALDTDTKSDNSGTAKMTWICHGVPYTHKAAADNFTNFDWSTSDIRDWLISDILSKIPTEIKSHIVSVKKSYRSKYPTDTTPTSNDEIWILSFTEACGYYKTTSAYGELDGVQYKSLFDIDTSFGQNNSTRIKQSPWYLRSSGSNNRLMLIDENGRTTIANNNGENGIVFGFCTD